MTDPTQLNHPNNMSAEDLATLKASDPDAFADDDAAPTDPEAGDAVAPAKDAADKAGEEDGGAAAAEGGEGASADDGGTGKTPQPIPQARLNEVVAQRNQAEALARQQAAELEELRARLAASTAPEPPKDFDDEFDAVMTRYEAGEIDEAEKDRELRKIAKEEKAYDLEVASHNARVAALETQRNTSEAVMARSWNEEVAAWSAQNPGFMAGEGNAETFQRAINAVIAFRGDAIANSELLAEASRMAFAETGYTPPEAAAEAGASAGTARRTQNAQRAAAASMTPPAINGGVGGRGGPERNLDVANLKPGTFSKLSKAEQARLLGDESAV